MRFPFSLASLLLALAGTALFADEPIKSVAPPSGETLPAEGHAGAPRVLLIGGGSSHDYEKWFHQMDSDTLKAGKCTTAYSANLEEAVAQMANADVLVISTNQPAFGAPLFQDALTRFTDSGKGVILLHPGLWYNWPASTGYNLRFAAGGARSHDALGPFTVTVKSPEHPIMKGVPATFEVADELYQVALEPAAKTEVLATTSVSKKTTLEHASVWTVAHPKAKIACIALGHDQRVHSLEPFKAILTNAVHWVAGE